jgi:RNA polymerase sigma-70 factor (ECF subfamily)
LERNEILALLRERIVAFAASRLAGDSAEDLAQEVLIVLHEKYAHVERLEELVPLSLQIVRFKIMGARRKILRRGENTQVAVDDLPLAGRDPGPLRTAEQRELYDKFSAAIPAMGPRCRDLLRFKLQGKTFPEIRVLMGAASLNTIYTWDFRCRKELLARMGITRAELR